MVASIIVLIKFKDLVLLGFTWRNCFARAQFISWFRSDLFFNCYLNYSFDGLYVIDKELLYVLGIKISNFVRLGFVKYGTLNVC